MDWAKRRQLIIIGSFITLGVLLIAAIAFAVFYKVPTCTDGKQNQEETGIDCGGPCAHACIADVRPAQVRFARAVVPAPGRTDVIAYIDNPNANAEAHAVQANVEVYDVNHVLLAHRTVHFDLPPSATVPVFVEGITDSPISVTQTFFTIDDASVQWVRTNTKPVVPGVQNISWQTGNNPRVAASLVNPLAYAFTNVTLIAVVFDADDQAIAASRTLVATLPPQGTAPLIFTWNAPFSGIPARVEVMPVVPVRVP